MVGPHALGGHHGETTAVRPPASPAQALPPLAWVSLWMAALHPCPAVQVGTMLKGVARVHHHDGFKAAWQECGPQVVLKHLDCDAPALQVRQ